MYDLPIWLGGNLYAFHVHYKNDEDKHKKVAFPFLRVVLVQMQCLKFNVSFFVSAK